MRIIKRGRRHIVIYPGSAPLSERERRGSEAGSRDDAGVVRFDQLPQTLQHVLSKQRAVDAQGKRG